MNKLRKQRSTDPRVILSLSSFASTAECKCCDGTGRVIEYSAAASYLRTARTEYGIKLRELSEDTGYSISYISDLEHSRRRLSLDQFYSLQRALIDRVRSIKRAEKNNR